jgi:hypothetical protein
LGEPEPMAKPKHKPREKKNKTIIDKLKGSALFLLFIIVLVIIDVVSFIIWLSGLLSGNIEGMDLVTSAEFIVFASLAVLLGAFFLAASIIQRRAHGA